MNKEDFDEFIKKQEAQKSMHEPIDWNKHRDEWLCYLAQFYTCVEDFLREYVDAGKVTYNYSKKKMFEEYIGSYFARALDIELVGHKLKLEPVGTNLIGAKGRVDLVGAKGKVKFVLVKKKASAPTIKVTVLGEDQKELVEKEQTVIDWAWKIATPPPRISYIDLKQDTFLSAVMEVING